MAKLSHQVLRQKMYEQNWKQEPFAEPLSISDRHVRYLCVKDTDAAISLCYRLSQVLGTTIEELLVFEEDDVSKEEQ